MGDYRILVTGSRSWTDYALVAHALGVVIGQSGAALSDIVIVHGACPSGADAMAARLARQRGYRTDARPADWNRLGNRAGFIRNAEMVASKPDICVAFIRAGSRGATHCADLAEKAGVPTRRYTADG
jgi:hypothetical protein